MTALFGSPSFFSLTRPMPLASIIDAINNTTQPRLPCRPRRTLPSPLLCLPSLASATLCVSPALQLPLRPSAQSHLQSYLSAQAQVLVTPALSAVKIGCPAAVPVLEM